MLYNMTPEQFLKLMENPWFVLVITVASIWALVWKGIALWKAARNYQTTWFVVLLAVNTLGILEILYIFVFNKKTDKNLPANQ